MENYVDLLSTKQWSTTLENAIPNISQSLLPPRTAPQNLARTQSFSTPSQRPSDTPSNQRPSVTPASHGPSVTTASQRLSVTSTAVHHVPTTVNHDDDTLSSSKRSKAILETVPVATPAIHTLTDGQSPPVIQRTEHHDRDALAPSKRSKAMLEKLQTASFSSTPVINTLADGQSLHSGKDTLTPSRQSKEEHGVTSSARTSSATFIHTLPMSPYHSLPPTPRPLSRRADTSILLTFRSKSNTPTSCVGNSRSSRGLRRWQTQRSFTAKSELVRKPTGIWTAKAVAHRLQKACTFKKQSIRVLDTDKDRDLSTVRIEHPAGRVFGRLLKGLEPLVRFRRAAKLVQLLLTATASSSRTQQHDQVSWTQIVDEQSTARRTYDLFGISFDPTLFKAQREKFLGNEAKAILSMDPCLRTNDQLKLALLSLNQTVDQFGEFPINLQRSLARVGWYENFESKRVIIRQGHMADNFYFIISGTAIVTILETNKDTGEELMRTVAFLRKGNSFGELALMHGARRSATVTCQTNVELLAVSREDFIDIFMHIEKDKEPEHIAFLRSVDLLRDWPIASLPHDNPRVCLFTFFRRGVLLCKDSNNADWIYIVKSGTCRVLKDLLETRPNIPGLECIEYTHKQTFVKLPPVPAAKSVETSGRHVSLHINGHKSVHRRLPSVHSRTEEQITAAAQQHRQHIEEIFDRRHAELRRQRQMDSLTPDYSHHRDGKEDENGKVFVQIQKLGPKEIFGLEQSVFGMMGQTTGCSLVSDGAECILINKKFFLQQLSDDVAKQMRKTIQPIPTEESLQQKLQDQANWDAFKSMTVSNCVVLQKRLHERHLDALYI